MARLRRKHSSEAVAQRVGIARKTLSRVEQGDPAVALGVYARVMQALRLEDDFATLAADDPLGRKLQDASLTPKRRAPKRSGTALRQKDKESSSIPSKSEDDVVGIGPNLFPDPQVGTGSKPIREDLGRLSVFVTIWPTGIGRENGSGARCAYYSIQVRLQSRCNRLPQFAIREDNPSIRFRRVFPQGGATS
jgi:transcriptional regulator with XRE-family HTH domain